MVFQVLCLKSDRRHLIRMAGLKLKGFKFLKMVGFSSGFSLEFQVVLGPDLYEKEKKKAGKEKDWLHNLLGLLA
jgi:hypothetical protein